MNWILVAEGAFLRRLFVAVLLACVTVTILLWSQDYGRQSQILFVSFLAAVATMGAYFVLRVQVNEKKPTFSSIPVRQLVENEPEFAFLTDDAGNISAINDKTHDRFGPGVGKGLSEVLGAILANPDGILFDMFEKARGNGNASETISTRGGQFGLIVCKVSTGHYIWRLKDETSVGGLRNLTGQPLSIPMLTVGSRGAVLYTNEACRKLLGYRPRAISEIFGDTKLVSGAMRSVAAEQGQAPITLAVIEGTVGRKEVYLIPSQKDAGPRTLPTEWDAIEDLPVPLLKIGVDGAVRASNREARGLLDVTSTDGKRIADVLDGLGRPIGDWIKEAIDGRGGYGSQFLRGRGDNHDTFVQVTLNIAGGKADPHLVAVLNDVTELKTLEAQFVQSQKMQAIGQLAGGVAHDFNNLLTAISGHCDLLLLRHDQGDQNYGDLIQIHQNANRAASLVGQLLAFSRKQNLQPEVIDLRDTLSDLTHLLNRLVGEKVVLSLSHAQDLECIKADKRQLEQVMMNLVVNARDAMRSGGEIRIVTKNVTYHEQVKRDRAIIPPGEYVFVQVSDEGHGIAPEKLPKIFEPFYTTKRTGEGTGLGLSTAYGIVKQTGGFIFAESEVDRGTEFTLLFPVHTISVAPAKIPAKMPTPLLNNEEEGVVLLVEDEAPVRAFAARALRLRGYTVLEANCAETALSMLADGDLMVDIFVTDVIMPGMDGPTWVSEALQDRPDTKVVFVSGYAEDAFGDEGPQIPNSVFLPKPFSLSDLTHTVQAQLSDAKVPETMTS